MEKMALEATVTQGFVMLLESVKTTEMYNYLLAQVRPPGVFAKEPK